MAKHYFSTKKMCVGYDNKPLIRDIEITLDKGEILCLIGPNGAGKSTVLKSIARQLKLIGGTVYLGNEAVSGISGMKANELPKKMSVLFTEKINAEMKSCRDVVAMGRYPYTGWFGVLSKDDEDIIDEAVGITHITDIIMQDFNKISDGQKQRVMLARAICQQPEIIILDEPTSFLDIKYKLEFLAVLHELKEKKKLTVIMSLHELELAKIISDKILCLKDEYVDRYGTSDEIFKNGYIEKLFDIDRSKFADADNEGLLSYIDGLEFH